MTTTFTKNLRLPKVDFLTEPWQQGVSAALDAIDLLLYSALLGSNIQPWANNTAMSVGFVRTDTQLGTLWICIAAHTSAIAPTTFAQDRIGAAANKWTPIALSMTTRGQWAQNTQYNLNDMVFDITGGRSIIALCTTANLSNNVGGGTILTDSINWAFIFNGTSITAANGISYSNGSSGLVSTNVQAAIDEIVAREAARFLRYDIAQALTSGQRSNVIVALQLAGLATSASYNDLFSGPVADAQNITQDNGSFEVWQRGAGGAASFAVPASTTQYTADRWYIATGVGQACTVSQVAGFGTGALSIGGSQGWACKIQRNAGQTGVTPIVFGFPLDIDECLRLRSYYMYAGAIVKAGANWSPASGVFTIGLYMGTGNPGKQVAGFTGQTVYSENQNVQPNLSTPIAALVNASQVPANISQAELQFSWTPTGTAGADDSITIDEVFLIPVTVPNPHGFPVYYRPSVDRMLLGCKRHYQKSFIYPTAPAQAAGGNSGELQVSSPVAAGATISAYERFPVSMRIAPTVVLFNPQAANGQIRNETLGSDCTGSGTFNITQETLSVFGTTPVSTVAGNSFGVHFTADAGI